MLVAGFTFVQLRENQPINFDCGDDDLNEFFTKDWFPHFQELMAVTYCVMENGEPLAMFSLFNDKIDAADMDKLELRRLERGISYPKRYHTYPAVKIGRLGVHKNRRGEDVGTDIIEFLKAFFLIRNKTGCRFITVDSYPQIVRFYQQCGFKVLNPHTERNPEDNVLMVFDLMPAKKALELDPTKAKAYEQQIIGMMS